MNAIFWMLLLSHLIADYPLQTDWLMSVKRTWWGLALHVGVHLLVMLALAGQAMPRLWPYLVGLAIIHYAIDSFKNWLSRVRPTWVNGPYIFDQLLHLLSLIVLSAWIQASLGSSVSSIPVLLPNHLTIVLSGLIFCTIVWYITERVLSYNLPDYQREVVARCWARLVVRTTLFFIFLWIGFLWNGQRSGFTMLSLLVLPYPTPAHRRRALLTDVAVALTTALLVLAVL